jgi:3-oxoacyl-[acyl-carrier-protein] synthase-1
MTAPHPEGTGAITAMEAALDSAGIHPNDIAYVNLHGTGTVLNDRAETAAMYAVFNSHQPPASSTKPITGHTLGAAGALELALCWGVLEKAACQEIPPEGGMPVHCWDGVQDQELPVLHLVTPEENEKIAKAQSGPARQEYDESSELAVTEKIRYCMSNSFAFGGCNVSLIIGAVDGL